MRRDDRRPAGRAGDRRLALRGHARGRAGLAGHARATWTTTPAAKFGRGFARVPGRPISAPSSRPSRTSAASEWHGLNASARLEPVDAVRVHRVLRPPVRRGTRSASPAPPTRAATRTPASTRGAVRGRRRPPVGATRSGKRPLMTGGARAQRVGLAAAQRRHPDQPPAARRTCAGSPTPTRSTWSSWAAARAARRSLQRLARRGLAGRRPGRRAVLGPGRRLGQRRGRLAPPVLDRAAGHQRRRPGAARLEQLRPRRRRLDGALRRLHPAASTPATSRRCTRDGVGADWPISYDDLRPYYERHRGASCRSPARTGRGATRTPTRTAPHPVGGNGEIFLRGAPRARASRPRSARSPSPTAGSATGRTASTAASACRAARSTPRPPR